MTEIEFPVLRLVKNLVFSDDFLFYNIITFLFSCAQIVE